MVLGITYGGSGFSVNLFFPVLSGRFPGKVKVTLAVVFFRFRAFESELTLTMYRYI